MRFAVSLPFLFCPSPLASTDTVFSCSCRLFALTPKFKYHPPDVSSYPYAFHRCHGAAILNTALCRPSVCFFYPSPLAPTHTVILFALIPIFKHVLSRLLSSVRCPWGAHSPHFPLLPLSASPLTRNHPAKIRGSLFLMKRIPP